MTTTASEPEGLRPPIPAAGQRRPARAGRTCLSWVVEVVGGLLLFAGVLIAGLWFRDAGVFGLVLIGAGATLLWATALVAGRSWWRLLLEVASLALVAGLLALALLWRSNTYRPWTLQWNPDPNTLVVSAGLWHYDGHEYLAQVYGDRHIVWLQSDGQTAREGYLTSDQMTALLWRVIDEALMQRPYDPFEGVLRGGMAPMIDVEELSVKLTGWHRWNDAVGDAKFPAAFDFVTRGAGLAGTPFAPTSRYLVAYPEECRQPVFVKWSASALGLALAQAVNGHWVTGAALGTAEHIVSTPGMGDTKDGAGCYHLTLFPAPLPKQTQQEP